MAVAFHRSPLDRLPVRSRLIAGEDSSKGAAGVPFIILASWIQD
jgi:hypothetical protein